MLALPIIAGFFSLAAAQKSLSTSTETLAARCITQSGPKSRAQLPTTTKTPALTTRVTSNLTTTPIVTFTPSVEIDTIVVNITLTNTETQQQSTNVVLITDTQYVTSVATVTVTDLTTSFTTEYETTTTSATILPSSGFMPIQSVISLAGNIPGKRDNIFPRAKPAAQVVVQDDSTIRVEPKQYPVRVQCLKVIYVTITRFKTFAAEPSTVTASASRTSTIISSTFVANETALQADVTRIVTETTVSTVLSTLTQTQSATVSANTTVTIYSTYPTPFYAACGPENIARSVDGVPIGRMGVKNAFGTLSANTPYDCCVRGIEAEYAGTFFQKGACFLIAQAVPTVCDASEQAFTFNTVSTLDAADGIVLSDGNCGQGQLVQEPPRPVRAAAP